MLHGPGAMELEVGGAGLRAGVRRSRRDGQQHVVGSQERDSSVTDRPPPSLCRVVDWGGDQGEWCRVTAVSGSDG